MQEGRLGHDGCSKGTQDPPVLSFTLILGGKECLQAHLHCTHTELAGYTPRVVSRAKHRADSLLLFLLLQPLKALVSSGAMGQVKVERKHNW